MLHLLQKTLLVAVFVHHSMHAYDFLLEGKAAYFLPTGDLFKKIYHNGGGIYGSEFTARIWRQLYGFASADFFSKQGFSPIVLTPTTVHMQQIGIGLKYLHDCSWGDLYLGLGALPTHIKTIDCSPYVVRKHTKWGCGGVLKAGIYVNLCEYLFLDLFLDYSFATISFCSRKTVPTIPHDAHVSGCWFGAGFGFRFSN